MSIKASAAIFHGYLKGGSGETAGTEVYIHTYWTGSVAGVYDVAAQNSFTGWVEDPPSLGGNVPGTSEALGTVAGTNPATVTGVEVCPLHTRRERISPMQSCRILSRARWSIEIGTQNGSVYTGGQLATAISSANLHSCGNSTRHPSSAALTDQTVGIAPMLWVVGNSSIAPSFTKHHPAGGGFAGRGSHIGCIVLGTSTDEDNYVLLIGRNEDSGTRNRCARGVPSRGHHSERHPAYLPTFTSNAATQAATPGYSSSGNPAVPEGGVGATVATLGLWPTDWSNEHGERTLTGRAPAIPDSLPVAMLRTASRPRIPWTGLSFTPSTLFW